MTDNRWYRAVVSHLSRERRRWLLATGAVAVLGAAVTIVVVGSRGSDTAVSPVVVRTIADDGERERFDAAANVVTALPGEIASGDTHSLTEEAAQLLASGAPMLPPDTTLTPEPESWRRTGAVASMTVTASTPGVEPRQFVVVFVYDGDAWKLMSTMAVGS